jgi:hypothetical protein
MNANNINHGHNHANHGHGHHSHHHHRKDSPTKSHAASSKSSNLSFTGFKNKEVVRCMFCGGSDCSKCGVDAYKKLDHPAIDQLHSHWITDYIIAMQRPNNTSLQNGALADMTKKKVTAIFNLTEPGEHPYCGTGNLKESGFPYSPELVMSAGGKWCV